MDTNVLAQQLQDEHPDLLWTQCGRREFFVASFDRWYALLLKFVARTGHARVPSSHLEDGAKLGQWTVEVRAQHKGTGKRQIKQQHQLSPRQYALLEQLPQWRWTGDKSAESAARFDRWYALLLKFVARAGHARVSHAHVEDGAKLGQWVLAIRMRYHGKHERHPLSQQQIERLEQLPQWSWRPSLDKYPAVCELLHKFLTREGHLQVRGGHIEDGFPLGSWVAATRTAYHRGRLSKVRIRLLEAIPGWQWRAKINDSFERHYQALLRFAAREGHPLVPSDHRERGLDLSVWCDGRRSDYRHGQLSTERIELLEQIPGWHWSYKTCRFEHFFSLLLKFVARTGHARVPASHLEDGEQLGSWLVERRRRHRGSPTNRQRMADTPEQVQRLAALPGWSWDAAGPSARTHWRKRGQVKR
jgi:hypothetical protein